MCIVLCIAGRCVFPSYTQNPKRWIHAAPNDCIDGQRVTQKVAGLGALGEPETFSVGGVAGLCVVWKSPANAQWLVRLRVDGKPKNVSLGGLKSMGLKEAREIALYVREHGGQLPVESAPEVVEEKHTDSVAKLWPQWVDAQRKKNKWKSKDDYRHAMQRGEKYVFPCIGEKSVSEVTAKDVAVFAFTQPRGSEKPRLIR